MKPIFVSFSRFLQNLRRRFRQANLKLLEERGENVDTSFLIREATEKDIVPLSHLHVKTWSDTYPMVTKPPTIATREWQWKELFSKKERNEVRKSESPEERPTIVKVLPDFPPSRLPDSHSPFVILFTFNALALCYLSANFLVFEASESPQ